ncbi:MAG: Gfo/Idh/MocA family oxidoreductase [Planctomycetota bacterium]|nr:Gfo/Idh/MocA family oxidoreductase [Planctomycetota bacterium]MDA1213046.1 Gfo/Idh/MocA family oxidoreductase [Planctomycetota bacterium]
MAVKNVRIGIIGAGENTRVRHIPGFRAIAGVEIVGVVNSTPESSQRVAQEFSISRTYPDWQACIADPDVDAVMIGTWPNLHCEVTCAALNAGKHVLTEARMARNVGEARKMLAASQAHPELVAQIVPSPFGLKHLDYVQQMIHGSYLGELREVVVISVDDMFWDYTQPLHWRQDADISGYNTLSLGIIHETLSRWVPLPTRVYAQTATFEPTRPVFGKQEPGRVTVPDSVQILTQFENGARGIYHISGVDLCGPGRQIHLYGSNGTIKLEFGETERLYAGRRSLPLSEIVIDPDKLGDWRVEAEFVGAIRGEEQVRLTDFETGVRYMEFTEAVILSGRTGQAIDLPLK